MCIRDSLLRDWPPHQVRSILMDTYSSAEFVDQVMREIVKTTSEHGEDFEPFDPSGEQI